jgi:hypothetical protein
LFFNADDTTYYDFVSEGQNVIVTRQRDIMEWLLKGMRRVRTTLYASNSWFFMHDNESPHNIVMVKQLLTNRKEAVLHYPPYLPDLTPAIFPSRNSNLP